mmetsp:Transcript_29190/g.29542  ORF Transcript_29190/g.29542 Transcript_29190/m.29542 type:complete len:411 (+) Transcript_29190:21-1253(+)
MNNTFLTRKQQWRRTRRNCRPFNDDFNKDREGNLSGRISSAPVISTSDPLLLERGWKTSGDLYSKHGISKNVSKRIDKKLSQRKLKFDTKVRVILIPTRDEYYDIGLGESLWWMSSDYAAFKQSAGMEFRAMLSLCNMDAKAAIALMYQSDVSYNKLTASAAHKDNSNHAVPISASDTAIASVNVKNVIKPRSPTKSVQPLPHVNSIQVIYEHDHEHKNRNDVIIPLIQSSHSERNWKIEQDHGENSHDLKWKPETNNYSHSNDNTLHQCNKIEKESEGDYEVCIAEPDGSSIPESIVTITQDKIPSYNQENKDTDHHTIVRRSSSLGNMTSPDDSDSSSSPPLPNISFLGPTNELPSCVNNEHHLSQHDFYSPKHNVRKTDNEALTSPPHQLHNKIGVKIDRPLPLIIS